MTVESLVQPDFEVKYGLPKEIKFCRKCVISNQRPSSAVEYQHTKDSKNNEGLKWMK